MFCDYLCWNLRITVVNMFLNIKIPFMFFVCHIYMINMGGSQFFNAWWVWCFFWSIENDCIILIICFFLWYWKEFYFIQTEVPFLNKTWSPFLCILFIMRRIESRGAYSSTQRNSARYYWPGQRQSRNNVKITLIKNILHKKLSTYVTPRVPLGFLKVCQPIFYSRLGSYS